MCLLIHMHLPCSASGPYEWEFTADRLKPAGYQEWVSATRMFSCFNIVMNLKPKNVWLILSWKCSCCGYTSRNFAAATFPAQSLLPSSPRAYVLLAAGFGSISWRGTSLALTLNRQVSYFFQILRKYTLIILGCTENISALMYVL